MAILKQVQKWLRAVLPVFIAIPASASVLYVNVNGTNSAPPFNSWARAATNIQIAVNVAQNNDTILVTNGIYKTGGRLFGASSNRVAIDSKILTLQSVNGPAVTIIEGAPTNGIPGTVPIRCVYLSLGSVLSGFTLTNGSTAPIDSGGGVYCASTTSLVTNCVIIGNSSTYEGGGVYSGTFINCALQNNKATGSSSSGGGAYGSTLINCVLTGNFCAYIGGAAAAGTMINCTVVSNSAAAYAGTAWNTSFKNSIVYYNHSYLTNDDNSGSYGTWTNCCTSFTPSAGANNFTNAPLFADLANANYHLSPVSPCINAGSNSLITNSTDFDGSSRLVGGTVDVGAFEFQSVIRFVSLNSFDPAPPYTNWAIAAANIQDAIDVSAPGDFVIVSNGTYNTGGRAAYGTATNRVAIDKAVTVQSLNGPASTAIAGLMNLGAPPSLYIRCVYLTNNAILIGFTLTNGATHTTGHVTNEQSGAGAWCESTSAILSNCVIRNCTANQYAGGVYQGTLLNCTVSNNSAFVRGGGTFASILNNCLVNSNRSIQGFGGGVAYGSLTGSLLINNSASLGGGSYAASLTICTLSNNSAGSGGGGSFFGTLYNCLITSNHVNTAGAGAYSNTLFNCIITQNATPELGAGAFRSTLNNCLVVSNKAGAAFGGVQQCILNNSIALYNIANTNANYSPSNIVNYSCTTPLPTNGVGNITLDPLFVNLATGNFHLQSNSPCINAGNNAYADGLDYDGNPRIASSTVDIGPFEFQSPGSTLSYAWAQQFGLPTDGSADFIDSDGDGLNNWQEWRADTSPSDASSVLQIAAPTTDASSGTATITWQSVSNIFYYVQRSPDFTTPFSTLQSNIVGQTGTTTYTDTNTVGSSLYFYRVGVQ